MANLYLVSLWRAFEGPEVVVTAQGGHHPCPRGTYFPEVAPRGSQGADCAVSKTADLPPSLPYLVGRQWGQGQPAVELGHHMFFLPGISEPVLNLLHSSFQFQCVC